MSAYLDAAKRDPTAKTPQGKPILLAALERSVPTVIRDLLKAGVQMSGFGGRFDPPLHFVAERRHGSEARDLVRLLMESGADPNEATEYGSLPLGRALDVNNLSVAKELVLRGADVDDPRVDKEVKSPLGREALARLRRLKDPMIALKETLVKEAITQQAEATPLDETGRRMTGIPPDVPGPQIVSPHLLGVKEGPQPKRGTPNDRFPGRGRRTQKSTARHRKKSRRTRRH